VNRRSLHLAASVFALQLFSGAALGSDPPSDPTRAELASDPIAAEAHQLSERLRETRARRLELLEQARQATGERRRIFEEQAWQRQREAQSLFAALAENLIRQREGGRDISDVQKLLTDRLAEAWPVFRAQLETLEAEGERLLEARDVASGNERLRLEKAMSAQARRILGDYRLLVAVVRAYERLGVDMDSERAFAVERLESQGEYLSAALRLAVEQRDELRRGVSDDPGNRDLQLELDAASERLDRVTHALSLFATLLSDLGVDTARHRQLLFEVTGEVTTDVLDKKVAMGLLETWRARVFETLVTDGSRWMMKAFVFLLILAVFRLGAALARRVVHRSVSSTRLRFSKLLQDTLVSWSSRVVMTIGVLVALSQLGVAIAPLLAGLGIAGFVLGFALQDSLSNFAAGAMILMYRPYDVGDLIEAAGVRGKVSRMSLVSTTILTIDNQTLIVPNSKIWGDVIVNVTAQTIRRIDMVFGVSYAVDVDRVDAVLRDILTKHEQVLDHPEPIVEVHNLGDSSVDFAVRPWVRTDDYWPVYWSLHREVKKRLDAEGISIPFPQRDVRVRVVKESSE
jgi:small conductance mechanosensitive channel